MTADIALIPDLKLWLVDFVRAMKGFRVYADNNEMLTQFVDQAFVGLEFLLSRDPELTLSIREDRILYSREAIHVNPDRDDGLPFLLYRNAFRRLVFVHGMSREELIELMRALSTDFSQYHASGEDLVTMLWRLHLPHLRYLTIDALSVSRSQGMDPEEAAEIERIQADIENIVGAIYRTSAGDDDLVAGVSISRDDLEALKEIRGEDPEELELLDQATERAITDIPEGHLARVQDSLRREDRDILSSRLLDILIVILFRETSGEQSSATVDLIQELFDAMVLARRYVDATRLVLRLRQTADASEDMQQMHIARHLLRVFATEARIQPVLSTLNEQQQEVSTAELMDFLRALGAPLPSLLLRSLDMLTSPAHRRALCDLIVEIKVPSPAELGAAAEGAKWFVVRDILGLAQHYDKALIGPLVGLGLNHENPKVRLVAVGMLRGYGRGTADQLLAERFRDVDLEVRLAAYRVAAARRSREAQPALEMLLKDEKLGQRDPRELRLMTAAYASLAGRSATQLLGKILNAGLFASFTNTEAQVGAAFALASLGPDAIPILQKGTRSLNPRVRDACRRALRPRSRAGGPQSKLDAAPLEDVTQRGRPPTGDGRDRNIEGLHAGRGSTDVGYNTPNTGAHDALAGAPPLRVDTLLAGPQKQDEHMVLERNRPPVPRYHGRGTHTDELTGSLPPPPSRDLPGAEAGQIPLDASALSSPPVPPPGAVSAPGIEPRLVEYASGVGRSDSLDPGPTGDLPSGAHGSGDLPELSDYANVVRGPPAERPRTSDVPHLDAYATTGDLPRLGEYSSTGDLPRLGEYSSTGDLPHYDEHGGSGDLPRRASPRSGGYAHTGDLVRDADFPATGDFPLSGDGVRPLGGPPPLPEQGRSKGPRTGSTPLDATQLSGDMPPLPDPPPVPARFPQSDGGQRVTRPHVDPRAIRVPTDPSLQVDGAERVTRPQIDPRAMQSLPVPTAGAPRPSTLRSEVAPTSGPVSGRLNVLGEHSVDLVSGNLPPAPSSNDAVPRLDESAPVVGSRPGEYSDSQDFLPAAAPLMEPPSVAGPGAPALMSPAGAQTDREDREEPITEPLGRPLYDPPVPTPSVSAPASSPPPAPLSQFPASPPSTSSPAESAGGSRGMLSSPWADAVPTTGSRPLEPAAYAPPLRRSSSYLPDELPDLEGGFVPGASPEVAAPRTLGSDPQLHLDEEEIDLLQPLLPRDALRPVLSEEPPSAAPPPSGGDGGWFVMEEPVESAPPSLAKGPPPPPAVPHDASMDWERAAPPPRMPPSRPSTSDLSPARLVEDLTLEPVDPTDNER